MAKSEPLKSTFSIRSLLDQNDHQGIDANNDVSDEANDEAVVGIIEEEIFLAPSQWNARKQQ